MPVDGDNISIDSELLNQTNRQNSNTSSNMTKSLTYESELDLVLEELSETETATVHSDAESLVNFHQNIDQSPKGVTRSNIKREDNSLTKVTNNKISHQPSNVRVETSAAAGSMSYSSLPRSVKSCVFDASASLTADNMGSWPRKASKLKLGPADASNTELPKEQSQSSYKRRSLSPGKLKTSETNVKVRSLIEEARKMSSVNEHDLRAAHTSQTLTDSLSKSLPINQLEQSSTSDLISPYACSNITRHNFSRKPSYRLACSEMTSSCSSSSLPNTKQTNHSTDYKTVRGISHTHNNETENQSYTDKKDSVSGGKPLLARAPSYRMAQSQSFSRELRAPSYRKALNPFPRDRDSGLGSQEMTSSSDSNGSECNSRIPSYRRATEPSISGMR